MQQLIMILAVLAGPSLGLKAWGALEKKDDAYWKIHSVTVTEILPKKNQTTEEGWGGSFLRQSDTAKLDGVPEKDLLSPPPSSFQRQGEVDMFIMLGEKVAKLVEGSILKVNVADISPIDVLPNVGGAKKLRPFDLSGWSLPQVRHYSLQVKNLLNITVVDLRYKVFYSYGGTYDGTNGVYLASVYVGPSLAVARLGFDVSVDMEVVSLTNVGEFNHPIPALTFDLRYEITTYLSVAKSRQTYTVTGDGRFVQYE